VQTVLVAMLAAAKPVHRFVVARIDHEMKPAHTLHRDDLAPPDSVGSCQQRSVGFLHGAPVTIPPLQLGAAPGHAFGCAWKPGPRDRRTRACNQGTFRTPSWWCSADRRATVR